MRFKAVQKKTWITFKVWSTIWMSNRPRLRKNKKKKPKRLHN